MSAVIAPVILVTGSSVDYMWIKLKLEMLAMHGLQISLSTDEWIAYKTVLQKFLTRSVPYLDATITFYIIYINNSGYSCQQFVRHKTMTAWLHPVLLCMFRISHPCDRTRLKQ